MRNTRRFTLFLLIVSVVLSMSVLHVFADGEDTAAPAEEVVTVGDVFSTDPAAMTYDDFKRKDPVEIMQEIYRKICNGEEMPAHLLDKLNEVVKEVRDEN